ncbi:MAG: DUF1599 domain-containing protein [Bacteroidetes bacterium]|jgi:hypothetical protein|nr:DUF1599 domain-containing protein [Bacteroidota bacterium]MBK9402395.1 DUF1599 domain-containing protein [Bacteroidota bacterium]
MSSLTSTQYDEAIARCKDIYLKKMKDYGSAWRILRPSSLTDQIFIKAQRIRSIEEKGKQKVIDGIDNEFIGIVNYAVMALIQLGLHSDAPLELNPDEALKNYEQRVHEVKSLMMDKNHDYGEAWRDMRVSSMTDLILMKLLRIKQIEDNSGSTLISEGVDANYADIINYAIFALIKLKDQ